MADFRLVPGGHRWRRTVAAIAVATIPFTMTACAEDEPAEEPGIVEEQPEEEEE